MRLLPLDKDIKEIEIYVIVSQISNEFYVWKAKSPNSYQAYKDHLSGKYHQTKKLFQRSIQNDKLPKMFLLESLRTTQRKAYRHCLAWTKYFIEQGMVSLSSQTILDQVNDLLDDTKAIFDAIKNVPMENVLCDKHAIVANYKRIDRSKQRTPKNEIKMTVSHKEYEKIRKAAEKNGLSMSRYCKNMTLDGQIINFELPDLQTYTAEVRGAKAILKQVLLAIYYNKKYFPADLENIQKAVDMITECECKVSDSFHECAKEIIKLKPK